jgi:hypothetical protein
MERLQPFHVKVSAEALALTDFHANITNTETVGYISGQWNGDQNCEHSLGLEISQIQNFNLNPFPDSCRSKNGSNPSVPSTYAQFLPS